MISLHFFDDECAYYFGIDVHAVFLLLSFDI